MLAKVKCPWKWLEDRLNEIVDQVNRQTPVQGNGLTFSPSPSGVIISVIPISTDDSSGDSSNAGGGTGSTVSPNVSS